MLNTNIKNIYYFIYFLLKKLIFGTDQINGETNKMKTNILITAGLRCIYPHTVLNFLRCTVVKPSGPSQISAIAAALKLVDFGSFEVGIPIRVYIPSKNKI